MVAVDEIVVNIVSYSGGTSFEVAVELAENPTVARITFSDDGRPWNPLEHADPDIRVALEDRPVGGLGILMVKSLMDDVSYARRDDRNVLSVRRTFESA